MTKTAITIIAIVAVLVIGVGGYAIWNNANQTQIANQTSTTTTTDNNTTTTDTTTTTAPQAGIPAVQTNATAVPYISTVVVEGTVNPNGALTNYWYEIGTTTALGTQTTTYLAGSGYTKLYTPAYITGLKANTTYYYRLDAKNAFGTVTGTTYSFTTNSTPPPQGTAPSVTTTAAAGVTRTTANLPGKISPNDSSTTYWFEYGTSTQFGSVTALQSGGSGTNVSVSVSNLQPSTKYYFRLNAQNQFGTVNGQILNFTTQGPSATVSAPTVSTNSASSITNSSAKLNAAVNPNGANTTYWFEYSTDSLVSKILVSSTPPQSLASGTAMVNVSANITGLKANTKYYVKILANNQDGTTQGDIQSFTTSK
jgi:phosphodiesterase/alkaline phosphatase D-like protein